MPNNTPPQVLITPLKPALILGMAQKLDEGPMDSFAAGRLRTPVEI